MEIRTVVKSICAIALILGSNSWVLSQDKELTLNDAVLNRDLRPEKISQVGWIKGTNTAYYVHPDQRNKLIFYNVDSKTTDTTFDFKAFANSAAGAVGDTLRRLQE